MAAIGLYCAPFTYGGEFLWTPSRTVPVPHRPAQRWPPVCYCCYCRP